MSAPRDTEPRASGEERKIKKMKFSTSPFNSEACEEEEVEVEEEVEPLDIEVKVQAPEEVPWTDLLLEISMTTAFASLTDGTPILQPRNGLSYVCYFVFVWWIWVSQVCYNMRFRQRDLIHRIWMFLQLAVFSALAAFTKDFDITNGLVPDHQQDEANRLLSGEESIQDVTALQFRQNRLPLLNAKGVSITMAISRVLLLVQYCVVFYHAKTLKRESLLAHIIFLVFSALCYLGTFLMLHFAVKGDTDSPSILVSALKIVLWYLPIILEIASHYGALDRPRFVRYSAKAINARIGTLFLIILGAGLDKITGGFKTIIGNGGLGGRGIHLFIAASVIFIGFFSLYFATPGRTSRLGRKLLLTWFFSQFFFLAALIISLQGIANSLQFSNINAGIINAGQELERLFKFQNDHPGVSLTASNFEETSSFFRKLGTSLEGIVAYLNDAATQELSGDPGVLDRARLKLEVEVINFVLDTLEATPETYSLLDNKLYDFENADWDNTTELTNATFWDIKETIIRDRGTSGLWFYPSTGATILALGILPFFKGKLRDKWDWAIISCRLLVGGGAMLFGLLDIGWSKPIFDGSGNVTKSLIWRLILSKDHLQLVFMAIVIFLLLCVESLITQVFANRTYLSFRGIGFFSNDLDRVETYEDKTADVEATSSVPFENQHQRGPVQIDESYDPYRGGA